MFKRDFIASKTRRRVAVHLTDGSSLRGILAAVYPDCVALERAEALHDGGAAPIDGEALVPRDRLAWLQVLAPEED